MKRGIDIRHLLNLSVDCLMVRVRVRGGTTRCRLAQTRAPFYIREKSSSFLFDFFLKFIFDYYYAKLICLIVYYLSYLIDLSKI